MTQKPPSSPDCSGRGFFELELELTQARLTQKPIAVVEAGARAEFRRPGAWWGGWASAVVSRAAWRLCLV
jgi:hypothetical protein